MLENCTKISPLTLLVPDITLLLLLLLLLLLHHLCFNKNRNI